MKLFLDEKMSSSRDFIALSGDKNAKKKRHHESGRSGSDRDKSSLKAEARCPKLRERICKYLEENRFKVSPVFIALDC